MHGKVDHYDRSYYFKIVKATLKYRIPNQSIVAKSGAFVRIENDERPKGFVVTSFLKDAVFVFREGESEVAGSEPIHPVILDHEDYLLTAEKMIGQLQLQGGKAILSRVKKAIMECSQEDFFEALCAAYPQAFVYLISSQNFGCWIGATPETLLKRSENRAETMALAGTQKTSENRDWTEKEFEEHAFVADFIEERTRFLGVSSIDRAARETTVSGPVKHLLTRFSFQLPEVKEWEWVQELHPTPAVSGWPRDMAVDLIRLLETHDRSLYTGVIGVIDEETDLYVNLRCAQIIDNEIFLYLGGGYTKDSVPEDEWQETENKAKTLLNVLKKT